MIKLGLFALAVASLTIALPPAARAGVILDTGIGNSATSRTTDGPGQGVIVGATTQLTQFGFYLDTPDGADAKFMIWNGDNSSLLYSQTLSLAPSDTISLVLTNPFSFTLDAGSTYYFGVISDTAMNVSFWYPIISLMQNNLTLTTDGNSNYGSFDSPTFEGLAGATIALQLVNGGTAAPEPGTIGMFTLGALGLVALARKRKSAA